MLVLEHMGLTLDAWIPEPPATWTDESGATCALPARLLGAARLCALRSTAEMDALPLARADGCAAATTNTAAAITSQLTAAAAAPP